MLEYAKQRTEPINIFSSAQSSSILGALTRHLLYQLRLPGWRNNRCDGGKDLSRFPRPPTSLHTLQILRDLC